MKQNRNRLFGLGISLGFLLSCAHSPPPKETLLYAIAEPPTLMPIPQSVEFESGAKRINPSLKIHIQGPDIRQIKTYLKIFAQQLTSFHHTSIELNYGKLKDADLSLFCEKKSSPIFHLEKDESYQLSIDEKQIHIRSKDCQTLFWGLQTLLQLYDKNGMFPAVEIEDHPRFKWRGLLIDVARQWQTIETLKRNIDAMAYVKMNILHLHLSDDQGFRVESKKWPLLHQHGEQNEYYTQEEIRELITYAQNRGIHIIPEFDVPGHTTAWFPGYPQLASIKGDYSLSQKWGVHDAVMNPIEENTYAFLDVFFAEMAKLFPENYMHIGGDEVRSNHWSINPQIKKFMKKMNFNKNTLQAYFNQRIDNILEKHGKIMIGWDEIFGANIRHKSVLQIWRPRNDLQEIHKSKNNIILSRGYYLDHFRSAGHHYRMDPEKILFKKPHLDHRHLLGGEACMWGEVLSADNMDSRIWPRNAAIAERFWSAQEVVDQSDMYRRLNKLNDRLEKLGLLHLKHYHQRIQEMAKPYSAQTLNLLASLIEPKTSAARAYLQKQKETPAPSPLVEFVHPESLSAHHLMHLINLYLQNKSDKNNIENFIEDWHSQESELETLLKNKKVLGNLLPLKNGISTLFKTITEMIDLIESDQLPETKWLAETGQKIAEAKKPIRGLRVAFISGAEKLLNTLKAKATKELKRQ
jgi:hexosaminidase